jgi:hypothetical protein
VNAVPQQGFFEAAAGVSGTLIGLLFVAVSMARERLAEQGETAAHRVHGAAALVTFVNALCISLMALTPGDKAGWAALVVAVAGAVFIVASALALVLDDGVRWRDVPHLTYLLVLTVLFSVEFDAGLRFVDGGSEADASSTLSVVLVVCFLVGISRAWELVGGPPIGPWHQLYEIVRPLTSLRPPHQPSGDPHHPRPVHPDHLN